jgi:hypothetical protein
MNQRRFLQLLGDFIEKLGERGVLGGWKKLGLKILQRHAQALPHLLRRVFRDRLDG